MSDMQCQKCGMIFEAGKAYGYACQHRPNCGPMIIKSMAAPWGALPAVQPETREAALREAAAMVETGAMHGGEDTQVLLDVRDAILALIGESHE